MFPQLRHQKLVNWPSHLAMQGFGVDSLWDNTVVLEEVDCHIELTTVRNEVGGEVVDESVVDGKVGELD